MEDILATLEQLSRSGEPVALASLIESSGSIPMSERAKMVVRSGGRAHGTIGGGCLEAEILATAGDVLKHGRPHSTRYTMTEQQAGEHGLNCGGTVRIYTERVDPSAADLFSSIAQARKERTACVLATRIGPSPAGTGRALCHADGRRLGSLGSESLDAAVQSHARQSMERAEPSLESLVEGEDEGVEVFLEPFAPPPMLYIFGGGHVGGQICRLAHNVGFRVIVVDDRPLFASRARHPDADECIAADVEDVFRRIPIDDQTYVVAATRGHQHDEIVVEHAIRTPARYIGMLGSERKKMILWKRIQERGGSRERLDRIYAPIGLNIGADTPEEVAVSVVAELIQERRGSRRKLWKTKRPTAQRAEDGGAE